MSVIVPIYNVEPYLKQCVDSIIGQTYQNLEIILVDDGSADQSGKICDDFALQDSRVIAIHKEHGGNTSARKEGIKKSSGDYLMFVDSDDWIETDMCEKLINKAMESKAEIVRCALVIEDGETRNIRKDGIPAGVYRTEEERRYVCDNLIYLKERGICGTNNSLCTQLVARKVLMDVYRGMGDEIQYGEDLAYVLISILNSQVICITDWPLYHYRMREGSITHSSNPMYYAQISALYHYLRKVFQEENYSELLLPQLERFMDELVLRGMNRRFIIPRAPRIPDYMFSMKKLCAGAKIILYGAGAVGQSYAMQIRAAGIYEIAGWVDRDYEKYQRKGMQVEAVKELERKKYDYVLIAVKSEDLSRKIAEDLKRKWNVEDEKIVWERPIYILDYYAK